MSVRTSPFVRAGVLFVGLATPAFLSGQDQRELAETQLFTGAYEEAIETIRPLSREGAGSPDAVTLHVRILRELGRYDEALDMLGGREGSAPSVALERWKGTLLLDIGEWDLGEASLQRSVSGGAPDAASARLLLGEQAFRRGNRTEATETFDSFIDLYNSNPRLDGESLMAVAQAVTRLGRETPSLFQDALRAWDEAAERMAGDPRPRIAVGDLFLSKYVAPDAHEEYQTVLGQNPRHPDALVGEARAIRFDGAGGALAMAQRALETNPNHVGALTLIAELRLQAENIPAAVASAEAALDVNPRSLEALSVLAAAWHIAESPEAFAEARDRVLALNPAWPDLFTRLAQISSDHRKYADAVDFATQGVERDSLAWDAWGALGMNQLRIARIAEGRESLERAFGGDPYNPWFKNSLDLLDKMDGFGSVSTEHFEIFLPADEVELLGPEVGATAEEAFTALSERYGYAPPTPIRLELFPSSADFSVRTLGLVGLGALGVSFGSTVVMDSPSARTAGEFNWRSVLWHEIAHSFHLGMSDHNVPRWFSEGLAVREQRVARSYWGHRANIPYLRVYADGQMPPLSRMNEAFVRPAFPEQVVFGYLQGSLAFDWIEERWGFQAIRDFLTGYATGRTTGELTQSVLGLSDDDLDEAFDAYMRERFEDEIAATTEIARSPIDSGDASDMLRGAAADLGTLRSEARRSPGSFLARLRYGHALVRVEEWDQAEEELRAAQRLFPTYPGIDGPLAGLARIHIAREEISEAADALRALGQLNENAWTVHRQEAGLREQLGQPEAELRALERAVEVYPYDIDQHRRIGLLAMDAGELELAVAARRSVVALDPVDMAQAQYLLARSYFAAGDTRGARSAVLRALEIAPSFDDALDLLLEIRGGTR